ncbi:uncharacterized protein LOC131665725 [Phymastichus coffea]|uniref:uncharacterized protein LOC131665725 n=1 Tax=Phymastichus coffea TaxID=108790 RepID=UPI00273AC28F|nr:uncharacterized protein LOC131665725 [Phymastichus coffea]
MNSVRVAVLAFCFAGAFAGLAKRTTTLPPQNITRECLEEYGVDIEQTGGFSEEEMYCIPACAYKNNGIMRSDGTIDTAKVESYFDANDVEERNIFFSVYEPCRDGKTHCKLVQCMFEHLKYHWKGSQSNPSPNTKQFLSQLV